MHQHMPQIFFEITDRCNHACRYCCKGFRGQHGRTMDAALMDRVLALPGRALTVSGGEPGMAQNELAYVLERARGPIAINTNLTAFTGRELQALAGRARLNVSIPSMFESEYRAVTGADTFARLLANLEHIDRESLVEIVVHEGNRERLTLTVDRLAVRGFTRLLLQPAYANRAESGQSREGGQSDTAALLRVIEKVQERHVHLDIRLMSPCGVSALPVTHRCEAGVGRFVVLVSGKVVPCACRELEELGDLAADTPPGFDALREAGRAFYQTFPPDERPFCKGYTKELPCC